MSQTFIDAMAAHMLRQTWKELYAEDDPRRPQRPTRHRMYDERRNL